MSATETGDGPGRDHQHGDPHLQRDHGDEPIHWPEIDADARERPLRVRRRRRGRNVSDVEHFDPRRS